jgi:uncharacterized protein YyaL (SSP411 family)
MSPEHDPGAQPPAAAHTNRLALETSPYLLQHAHNPVDWYAWGDEALERARREDKPIFLSIGYAACHWCHVMERESFENEATARQLNAGFVPIKVDREERPDLDAVYMDAIQAMTGQGGWPMSIFLTPEGRPFYGGTYFPDTSRHGLPGFRDVLAGVTEAWAARRPEVEEAAARLADAVARDQAGPRLALGSTSGATPVSGDELAGAVATLEAAFDPRSGGWGGAPKFPQSMTIEFLLREHLRSGDARALAMARRTLDAMANGGINDQLAGGFARYSTDAVWLVPHFEKMLYDNAQLARVYLHAWRVTGAPAYAEVARTALDFMDRDLRNPPEGGFAASLDADTNGEEGATYVWSAPEVREVLGPEADLFGAAYDVTPNGNWEGRSILRRIRDTESLAADTGLSVDEVERRLSGAREQLASARAARPQPRRDDKVLTAWNGLAVAAFAEAGWALGEPRYTRVAEEACAFLFAALRGTDGRLRRSWKDGRALHAGVLEDYTHLADGALALYESTFDERWFRGARELMEVVLTRFADPAGGFHDTADDHEALIARPRGLQDNALPSGNAMAVNVLLRLHALTGEARYRDAAAAALAPMAALAVRHPTAFAQWLLAIQFADAAVDEVAVIGDPRSPAGAALLEVARRGHRPWQVLAASADPSASIVPLLADRVAVAGQATAYACRSFVCRQPVTLPEALAGLLLATPPESAAGADGTDAAGPG